MPMPGIPRRKIPKVRGVAKAFGFKTKLFMAGYRPRTAATAALDVPMSAAGVGSGVVGPRKRVQYTITTLTGDLPGAGTGAGVFVTLHGTIADSKRFQLLNNGEKNFLRGNADKFTHTEPDLGEITSLTICQDGKSSFRERFSPDWFLERVSVQAGASEWIFPCRRWLSKDQDDRQMKRTLYARNAEAQIQYKVLTLTEDTAQATTTGRVHIQIHGDLGTAGAWTELKNPSLHDVFERGQKDMFLIRARPVGKLNAVSIRHIGDAKAGGGGWGLAGVVVRNMKTGEEFTFPCGSRIGANDTVNLPMRAGAQIQVGTSQAAQRLERRAVKDMLRPPAKVLSLDDHDPYKGMVHNREPPTRYDVAVTTSDVKNAGTDSNVFIRMFGTARGTGSIRLAAHATKTNRLFLRGSTDNFTLYQIDVGDLNRLAVWTDGRNLSDQGPTWHLKSVTIRKISHGGHADVTWTFPCGKLFDNEEGVGKIDLFPTGSGGGAHRGSAAAAARPRSAVDGGGRMGREGARRPASHNTDLMGAETAVYGSGYGGGPASGGRPQSARPATTRLYDNTTNAALERQLAGQVRSLIKVLVKTGNRPYAGTDCEVMCRIKGQARTSATHRLSNCPVRAGTLFRRGATDEFAFQDWHIGEPVQVSIWHDAKGSDPSWFLEKVTVMMPNGPSYVFKCEEWLSETEGRRQTRVELTNPSIA